MKTVIIRKYHGFKQGDTVMVKHAQDAYYGEKIAVTDVGRILKFPVKVRIPKTGNWEYDKLDYFAFVEFPHLKNNRGCGIDIINLRKVKI